MIMAAKKKASKKAAKKTAKKGSSANLVPLYILIIMVLAAALVMVINSRTGKEITSGTADKKNAEEKAVHGDTAPAADSVPSENALKKMKIYFLIYNERTGKISPASVPRDVAAGKELTAIIDELVKGPTQSEEDRGLISAMPEGMKVRSAAVKNGIAEIIHLAHVAAAAVDVHFGADVLGKIVYAEFLHIFNGC